MALSGRSLPGHAAFFLAAAFLLLAGEVDGIHRHAARRAPGGERVNVKAGLEKLTKAKSPEWLKVKCMEEGDCDLTGKPLTKQHGKAPKFKLWAMVKAMEQKPTNNAGLGDKHMIGDLIHRLTVNHPEADKPVDLPYKGGGMWSDTAAAVDYPGGTWVGDRGSTARDAKVLLKLAKKMQYISPGMARTLRDVAGRLTQGAEDVECDVGTTPDEREICELAKELKQFAANPNGAVGTMAAFGAPKKKKKKEQQEKDGKSDGGNKRDTPDADADIGTLYKKVKNLEHGIMDPEDAARDTLDKEDGAEHAAGASGGAKETPNPEEREEAKDKAILSSLMAQLPPQNISYSFQNLTVKLLPMKTDADVAAENAAAEENGEKLL